MDFYKKNQLDPLAVFGRWVLPGAAWALLPRLWFSRGQSIRDRVTCTVVVVDP